MFNDIHTIKNIKINNCEYGDPNYYDNDNDYDYELKLKDKNVLWSDMFYLLNYYQHGNLITLNDLGDEENINQENFINFDVSFLKDIKIPDNLIKIQSNINKNILDSKIAIFINFDEFYSEKYKTILKYLSYLTKNNINVDIYFGKDEYSAFRCNGFSLIENNLYELIESLNKQYQFYKDNFNYYLGFNLIKKYNLLLIIDELSEKSIIHNESLCENILYIVLLFQYHNMIKYIYL